MGSRSESVRRAWEHRRALWRVSPGELVGLQKRGDISESLKGYAVLAQEEALSLISALGGLENISEQRLVLIQDTVRLGLVLRAVVARFLQGDGDADLASKVGTLSSARRSSLQALGLERVAKELDLGTYLAEKSPPTAAGAQPVAASGTEDAEDDSSSTDAEEVPSCASAGDAPGSPASRSPGASPSTPHPGDEE